MAFTPTTGMNAVLKTSLGTGATDVTTPATKWKLTIDGKVYDASNFRDGRRRFETLDDFTLDFTLVWDGAEQQTKLASTSIRVGQTGTAKCYVDATHFFLAPIIISTMGPENGGVESLVTQDVQGLANGSITYPTDP